MPVPPTYAVVPMLCRLSAGMLANMSTYAEIVPLNWSDLAVSELPTGTVTLLLADVEGSTRLWETQPEQMAAAIARLNAVVSEEVARYSGVRPLEQGEGDSFVLAFAKASDAVACALALQRVDFGPVRMRIGVHTGEIQLRDDSNYAGPTINRTARLRDLAHGGQTVISGAAEAMVLDQLPAGAWLADLGTHPLRDLPRAERVLQLNHPDLRADFPPLRVSAPGRRSRLPVQLTSFVGGTGQIAAVTELLGDNRVVTLTGAGGAGKTRLALRVAAEAEPGFDGEVFFVDLAPITNPAVVPVAVARALELTDQPGRTTMETIRRFVTDRRLLIVLDNCEHVIDACCDLLADALDAGRGVSVLATSREPIGIPGEVTWPVPPLSIDDDAVALFLDRARKTRPDFTPDPEQTKTITEICRRLDGMPLAIELAAARTRTLSIAQILDSLRSSFRLLTGGARTAVRRQQTLSASIDWSHSLLTETERILLRRLAAFTGGFDLAAATAVGADTDSERAQLIDVLGLLVDKSLVVAEESSGGMRYRLLATVRQYSAEKLANSGEADAVRARHSLYYASTMEKWSAEVRGDGAPLVPWALVEMDNLRSAFAWSCENGDFGSALNMVSMAQRLWVTKGRYREGLAAFDAVFSDERFRRGDVAPAIWIRAAADDAILSAWQDAPPNRSRIEEALAVAREIGDDRLTLRALTACGTIAVDDSALFFTEAAALARSCGDDAALAEILAYITYDLVHYAGQPEQAHVVGEEASRLTDRLEDVFFSRYIRGFLSVALAELGRLSEAIALGQGAVDEARLVGDLAMEGFGLTCIGFARVFTGEPDAAHAAATGALTIRPDIAGDQAFNHAVLAHAALGRGDQAEAQRECDAAVAAAHPMSQLRNSSLLRSMIPMAQTAMARGDLAAARRWADETVAGTAGAIRVMALAVRARVAIAQGEPTQADRDAHDALAAAAEAGGLLSVPDVLECLAALADDDPKRAARLLGAAQGIRRRTREVRCRVFDAEHEQTLSRVRETLGENVFDRYRTEGEELGTPEAIAFAHRGRGERKRPASGWESLTPAERDVIRLLSEGLSNKEIAARLFISPRTAQTHLTHIYSKLNLSSRVHVVREAARHADPVEPER